jgi:CheY-like chemotaxis protein
MKVAMSSPNPKPFILVVDDDADLRSSYLLALQMEGYPAAAACEGSEALKLLRSLRPGIVMLDMNMPEMNGLEFLDHLSQEPSRSSIAVIAISADPSYAELARQRGAIEFVEKPVRLDYLLHLARCVSNKQPVSSELRTLHLQDRERTFREDDARRAAALAAFPLEDPAFRRTLSQLLAWLGGYFNVPMAFMNLLRGDSLEIFATYGVPPELAPGTTMHCEDTYCATLIRAEESLVLEDALLHPLYKSHAVHTQLGIRFYVSVPIRVQSNLAVGTLCLESYQRAQFFTEDLHALYYFADTLGATFRSLRAAEQAAWVFFPDPVFLDVTAFLAVLESRIARNRRVSNSGLVGFHTPHTNRALEKSLSTAFCQQPSRAGVALARGPFGMVGFGPKVALEPMIKATQMRQPRFAPQLFALGGELSIEFASLGVKTAQAR